MVRTQSARSLLTTIVRRILKSFVPRYCVCVQLQVLEYSSKAFGRSSSKPYSTYSPFEFAHKNLISAENSRKTGGRSHREHNSRPRCFATAIVMKSTFLPQLLRQQLSVRHRSLHRMMHSPHCILGILSHLHRGLRRLQRSLNRAQRRGYASP